MATIQIYWPGKFGGRLVQIESSDFNPAIHRLPEEMEPGDLAVDTIIESEPVEPPVKARTAKIAKPEPVKRSRK